MTYKPDCDVFNVVARKGYKGPLPEGSQLTQRETSPRGDNAMSKPKPYEISLPR